MLKSLALCKNIKITNGLELMNIFLRSVLRARKCQPLTQTNVGFGSMSYKSFIIREFCRKFRKFTIVPPKVIQRRIDFNLKSMFASVPNFLYYKIYYYETAIPKGTVLRKYVKEKNVLLFFKQARLMKF